MGRIMDIYVVAFINEDNEADARLFSDPELARQVYEELLLEDMAPELWTRFVEE